MANMSLLHSLPSRRDGRFSSVSSGVIGAWSRDLIERASPSDLMAFASDVSGAPMSVAAILLLDSGSAVDPAAVRAAIADRIRTVPRLRQRFTPAPFGCGRPYWVDDPNFDICNHFRDLRCPAPGDEAALLDVAADTVTRRLASSRPLWTATLVTDLADGGAALIVLLHHVIADGFGGLAVLAQLVDGAAGASSPDFPRSPPGHLALFIDALHQRMRAATSLPTNARRLRAGIKELALQRTRRTPRSSLNRPIGSRRRFAVARADLSSIQAAAHEHAATVNDVILTAVTGALHTVLSARGDHADRFVVSMPISGRREADLTELGNEVGAIPLALPAAGDRLQRLAAIARITRVHKTAAPGASAAVLGPAFRILAKLGALRWFVDRQQLVTTFVTNLRGPTARLSFMGAPIIGAIPVSPITGNITIAFAVLSYTGTLVVTVISDPERCTDLPVVVAQLQRELDALTLQSR